MYDLIIIGAGSAGYPAGIYASRYKLKTLIIGELLGGALTQSHLVENYPGFEHISGSELMERFRAHAQESGAEICNDRVAGIERQDECFSLRTSGGLEFTAKSLIIAIGNRYRRLGLQEEESFISKGVSYCATCDGMFFRGLDVAVIGGGNTAFTEALFLSEICKEVHIVHRRSEFRAEKVLIEKAKEKGNILFHTDVVVQKISGEFGVESIALSDGSDLKVEGVFVAIGNEPDTSLFAPFGVETDEEGYIRVDARQQTNIPFVYAAGDISTNSNKFKQTLVSAAEGALAAASAHEDLMKA